VAAASKQQEEATMKASDWATWIGTAVIVVLMVLALVGCGGDGKDGAQGPQGPAGADGRDGESYVSYTNAQSGNITTIAVTAGDNSPVEITINDASGTGAQAGTLEIPAAPAEDEEEDAEEGGAAP
jgi:hypothetical protein